MINAITLILRSIEVVMAKPYFSQEETFLPETFVLALGSKNHMPRVKLHFLHFINLQHFPSLRNREAIFSSATVPVPNPFIPVTSAYTRYYYFLYIPRPGRLRLYVCQYYSMQLQVRADDLQYIIYNSIMHDQG